MTASPNFVVVQVDDQATNSFKPRYMPQTFRWIVRPGTLFRNGLAAPPLCCPDRAGVLTGDYPHNDGVFSNHPGYSDLRGKRNTLPVWLSNAGYRTALIGKFLNYYAAAAGLRPAPGWDDWFAFAATKPYYDYTVSDNGRPRFFGSDRRDYSTDVLSRQAVSFLRRGRAGRPFFLWLTYNAPHTSRERTRRCGPKAPKPPDAASYRRFARTPLPHPPSFNEADVGDKPRSIRQRPLLGRAARQKITEHWRCTLATVAAMDRGIGKVMRALRGAGELQRTIVFYLSDNGFYFGEHRIDYGKQYPYEPALRVPYAVRVPPQYRSGAQRATSDQVVSNEDIAPTLLDYAGGVTPCRQPGRCRRIDGRSLAPLLATGGRWPRGRGVLAELRASRGAYHAIRTRRWIFVRYADHEKELYDLKRDPGELENLAGRPAERRIEASLARRLGRLQRCSGARGKASATDRRPACE